MSVPERPDEDVQWAEAPGADVQEPAALRPQGWPYGFVPPSAAFNWLQRSVGRWIQWLEAKVDGHVHDGGSDPGSVAKVDVKEHLGWGERGFVEVRNDLPFSHELEHRHKDQTDLLAGPRASYFMDRALARQFGFRDPDGHFDEEETALIEYSYISKLLRIYFAGDGAVEVESDLTVDGFLAVLEKLRTNYIRPQSGFEVALEGRDPELHEDQFKLKVKGTLEVTKRIHSPSTPIALASITSVGVSHHDWGIGSVNKDGEGKYIIYLDPQMSQNRNYHLQATRIGEGAGFIAATVLQEVSGGNAYIKISTFDAAGEPADAPFDIAVYEY